MREAQEEEGLETLFRNQRAVVEVVRPSVKEECETELMEGNPLKEGI